MPPSEFILLCTLLVILSAFLGAFFLLRRWVGPGIAWTFFTAGVAGFAIFMLYSESFGNSVMQGEKPRFQPAAFERNIDSCTPGQDSCRRT